MKKEVKVDPAKKRKRGRPKTPGVPKGVDPKHFRFALHDHFLGRSVKDWKSEAEVREAILAYFKSCDERGVAYTMPGLARCLGFASRDSLLRLEAKSEFFQVISEAKLAIEQQRNEQLVAGQGVCAGQTYDLRTNHQWPSPNALGDGDASPKGPIGIVLMPVANPFETPHEQWLDWWNKEKGKIGSGDAGLRDAIAIDVEPVSQESQVCAQEPE